VKIPDYIIPKGIEVGRKILIKGLKIDLR